MTAKSKVTLKISGIEYTVKGFESEEYLHKLGLYVDKKMTEIINNSNRLSTSMAAVLTALNVANDYTKIQEENDKLHDELEKVKEELKNIKAENEKTNNENSVLVSSNTQLQLELVKSDTELKEIRKSIEKDSKRNNKNIR